MTKKAQVLKRLADSIRLKGQHPETEKSYCRVAAHYYDYIRDLQAILGHKSLETTQTYRHPHLDRTVSPLVAILPALV